MKYFIADLHIDDPNILTYEHRPFENLTQMSASIIYNWTQTVGNDDEVYLLGDIGNINVLSYLTGKITIVCGNHDNYELIKTLYPNITVSKHPIMIDDVAWLSHEPIGYMAPEVPYINIHGHTHKFSYGLVGKNWQEGNRYFCCSVEQINYKPISMDEISKKIEYKPVPQLVM